MRSAQLMESAHLKLLPVFERVGIHQVNKEVRIPEDVGIRGEPAIAGKTGTSKEVKSLRMSVVAIVCDQVSHDLTSFRRFPFLILC